jgi:hypothetical protein
MSRRTPLPEALRNTHFSVEDALELEVPRGRLRSKDVTRPFRGVRSAAFDRNGTIELCRAYLPIMQPAQLFSHHTAARIYGIPLPKRLQASRELDVWAPYVQPKSDGTIGHRSRPMPVRFVKGFPVVAPAQVWVQLAASLSLDELIIVGDYLVRKKRPLCTLDSLEAAVRDARGVRGIRLLRAALACVRQGTLSPMETLTRLVLVRGGLPEPVIGHTIYDSSGGFIGTPDLAYVDEKIAIEYEGEDHWANRHVFADDIERRELMQEAGWYVIRVVSDHVYRQQRWLVERVARQLRDRRPRPTQSNAL